MAQTLQRESGWGAFPPPPRALAGAVVLVLLVVLLASCTRIWKVHVTDPSEALLLLESWEVPNIRDDLDRGSLRLAVERSLLYLRRVPPGRTFRYGPMRVRAEDVRATLRAFLSVMEESRTQEEFRGRMEREFIWFRAAGSDVFRTVLFTGYYEPLLEGSLRREGPYRFPIYRRPTDLLEIDLGRFRPAFRGQRIVARIEGQRVLPYYSRAQIDGMGVLAGRGLELVWLKDPLDLFFLHIQGSGEILLPDGRKIHVGYAGSNGHPYRSIGRILLQQGAIPPEKISMQAIKAYLRAHPEQMQEILFANPSYIFFRILKDGPLGSLGVPVTPGRTIATDPRLFPRGGLAFIRARKPVTDREGRIIRWERFSRFVLNQDSGGAIRGAGRADLFCGSGPEAELIAGHLQHRGRLYFLLWKGCQALRELTDAIINTEPSWSS